MMVTRVTEVSGARCKVDIDNQFAFVLYKGELRHYRIQENKELSEKEYREIMEKVLPRRAKLRCMNLLMSKEYTVHQMRLKLLQGGYPEEIAESALAYVCSYGYLDDLRYAKDYIESHENVRSRRRMEQDLMTKGISKEVLEEAWNRWEKDGGVQDETVMIRQLLEKKHYSPQQTSLQEKQKLYAFLLRRGYGHDAIRKCMSVMED